MATFYLPSSGGYSTSNEFIKYRIAVKEGTLSGRVRPITVEVQFYRTNTGYTTSRNGTCYCTIAGTKYDQDFTATSEYEIGYNSYTVLFSKTINITYDGNGKASVAISAYWEANTTSSGGEAYSSSSQGGTVTLTAISALTYAITYNANGGSGAPDGQTKTYNIDLTLSSTVPTRNGYTFQGWGTSASDTSVDYNPGATYSANAKATLYAIWSENYLKINYYSNFADYGTFEGEILDLNADENILIRTSNYYYDNEYNNGLYNIQNTDYLFLSRTGYTPTGYYGTLVDGGILVNESTAFNTGQAMAEALGTTLISENKEINLYVQWEPLNLAWYKTNGSYMLCRTYIKIDDIWQPAIMHKKIDGIYKRSIV